MQAPRIAFSRRAKFSRLNFVMLCLLSVELNALGGWIVQMFGLPLFLDSIGTIFSAALGGFLPGIVVGYASNMITSLNGDPTNAYYSTVNALIAVCAAWFANRGYFKRITTIAGSILAFSLIGGALGSLITLLLSGFTFGDGMSSPYAMMVASTYHLPPAAAQFFTDVAIDLGDKTITVIIALLLLHLIPADLREKLHYEGWQQTPISKEQRKGFQRSQCRVISLRAKLLLILMAALILIAVSATFTSIVEYHDTSVADHTKLGRGVAGLASSVIPADQVDQFLAEGENAPGYQEVEEQLYRILHSSPDIQYIYVYRIEQDGCHVVFDLDTEETEGSEPGEVIPFDEDFKAYLPDLFAGKEIEPVISHGSYGWLLTVYHPVYDENGVCQCYAAADISMYTLRSNEIIFLTKVASIFLGFFILIFALGMWLAEYNITIPINTMAATAGSFAYNTQDAQADAVQAIEDLNIHTGDEIENLYKAMNKTTKDMVDYIADVQHKTETISKMQNGLILVLADLVESRDKCTGDHIRKTAAYTDIILREMRKEGVYADQITDTFMQDVVNSAPLHDIGKIQVPDALLNKPGKLTDEEFAMMKYHTTAGSEVLDSAIATLSSDDAGYLKEARNLAHYHHEKWNGTGYPCGLKGEEIPLSARIMAVADVFDALVSQRSYKKPFTIEKALDIIREGSGSHFDPVVANAFLNAEEEVRKVAETNMALEASKQPS